MTGSPIKFVTGANYGRPVRRVTSYGQPVIESEFGEPVVESQTGSPVIVQGSAAVFPEVTAQADGWQIIWATPGDLPADFDPVGDPQTYTLDTFRDDPSGTPVRFTQNLTFTKRVRQPFPNETTLTPATTVMTDLIYQGDTATNLTNNSTRARLFPCMQWLNLRETVIEEGVASIKIQLFVAHAEGRNGAPAHLVRLRYRDQTSGFMEVDAAPTLESYVFSGLSGYIYEAFIPQANVSTNEFSEVFADIYPHRGGSWSMETDGDAYPSPNASPLRFWNNFDGSLNRVYAHVQLGASGGTVNTDRTAASATPFPTIAAAATAIQVYNNANNSRNNASGGVITLTAEVHLMANFSGVDVDPPTVPLIIEAYDPADLGNVVISDNNANNSNDVCNKVHFRNIVFRKGGSSGSAIILDQGGGADNSHIINMETCGFDISRTDNVWNAWLYRLGIVTMTNCFGLDHQSIAAQFTGGTPKTFIMVGCLGEYALQNRVHSAIACKSMQSRVERQTAAAVTEGAGQVYAFNHMGNQNGGSRIVNFISPAIDERGLAFVCNVFENRAGGTETQVYVHADANTVPCQNLILYGNTGVGTGDTRFNICYNDSGAISVIKEVFAANNVFQNYNAKTDTYTGPPDNQADGARVGNWQGRFRVGWGVNSYLFGSQNGSTPGPDSWIGEVFVVGENAGTPGTPIVTNWVDDQTSAGAGSFVAGDYTPGLTNGLATVANVHYLFDQAGRAVLSGAAKVGARQPV